jgi:hypothetical protein
MATRLVTIATFDMPPKAELARNALTAAGIQCILSDDNTLGMDWMLGNAIGWAKLQVREEDADKAVVVLEQEFGTDGSTDEGDVSEEAESTAPDDDESELEHQARTAAAATTEPDENPYAPTPGSREDYARRLFFAAWFGMAFPPAWIFAFYLFLKAAFKEGTLSSRGWLNLTVGTVVVLAGSVLGAIVWPLLFAAMFVRS